ncbi:hypothetical protein AURDEDRAFT_171201 [Auricularia subglabra TFB-10046 SS5]|uniref:F-box domain-containing protein n=1 Tax=Auricularia subglabra (strain TFB-10046 / SS5) TaxID=717982 RepID=J0WXP4_AURST|nr:hypothetical protein AURDEDRAFT_171201 [Auricularia subglabra TFB-10046 SS5]
MSDAEAYGVLRASFERCFEVLSRDATDAAKIQLVLEQLARVSRCIVSELVDDWHLDHDPLRRLPNELIAQCFASLPLRDRIRASHVCRGWRSIALAHPVVWADLDFRERFRDKESLLEMALERAALHPVVIRSCPEPTRPDSVVRILTAHMSHIQYLELPRCVSHATLSQHAPQLRYLRIKTACRIRPDFLGGCVGQLRTLKLRSSTFDACPALSTVTDLTLKELTLNPHFGSNQHDAYRPLFRLFPALQSLSVQELQLRDKGLVPDGPAPASLRHLSLETYLSRLDVCECYANWESVTPNLSHVEITQFSPPGQHLRHIVSGAVGLIILHECFDRKWRTGIAAVGPRGRRREVTFRSSSDDAKLGAQTLLDLRSGLEDVTLLNISANSLATFLPVLAVLPKLAHLTAILMVRASSLDTHAFNRGSLASFARVPEHCPRLQSITITVVSGDGQCPPSADHARILLSQLESIAHVQLPALVVMGFSEDITSGIHVPHFDGFQIAFEHKEGMAVNGTVR